MRLELIGFRAHGARPHDPPLVEPTRETLEAGVDVLRATGDVDFTIVAVPWRAAMVNR